MVSCGDKNSKISQEPILLSNDKDRVEVMYFYGKQSCMSCGDIEKYTKDIIRDSFPNEVESSKVILRIIDGSKKENLKIAEKYEIVGSGLIISKWEDGEEEIHDLTAFSFNHLTTGEKEFKEGFTKKLKSLL